MVGTIGRTGRRSGPEGFARSMSVVVGVHSLSIGGPRGEFGRRIALPGNHNGSIGVKIVTSKRLVIRTGSTNLSAMVGGKSLRTFKGSEGSTGGVTGSISFLMTRTSVVPLINEFLNPMLNPHNGVPGPMPTDVGLTPLLRELRGAIGINMGRRTDVRVIIKDRSVSSRSVTRGIRAILAILSHGLRGKEDRVGSVFVGAAVKPMIEIVW